MEKNDISLKRTFFSLQTVFGIISLTIFEFFFQQLPDNLQNVKTEQNVPNVGTEKESLPSLKIVKLIKNEVVDHFVERYLWRLGLLPMAFPRLCYVRLG